MKLLLDCHIAKATVQALRKASSVIEVEHLADWREGAFLRATDHEILAACHEEARIFVAFDQRTIPDLLRRWPAEGRSHSGVIVGDNKSVNPASPGEVMAALQALARELRGVDTLNLVRFLRRSAS